MHRMWVTSDQFVFGSPPVATNAAPERRLPLDLIMGQFQCELTRTEAGSGSVHADAGGLFRRLSARAPPRFDEGHAKQRAARRSDLPLTALAPSRRGAKVRVTWTFKENLRRARSTRLRAGTAGHCGVERRICAETAIARAVRVVLESTRKAQRANRVESDALQGSVVGSTGPSRLELEITPYWGFR
jgi:hypothetical protein